MLSETSQATSLFVLSVAASAVVKLWLARRQDRYIRTESGQVPVEFRGQVDPEQHRTAALYTSAKISLERNEILWDTAWLLLATVGGGLSLLDQFWRMGDLSGPVRGTGFLLSMGGLAAIVSLPFDGYRTFVLEAHFGFNRTSVRLFMMDLAKHALVSVALLAPTVYVILRLMDTGRFWWIDAWGAVMAFQLTLFWLYPRVIAPWFNRFQPLEDPVLAARIGRLLAANGLHSEGVFVMDGSRRSAHGNAYVTGIGTAKRIIFFDTLLAQLSPEEIESVLAHEIGHIKRRHVPKRIAGMATILFAAFALLGWLRTQSWFFGGLGDLRPSAYAALALFLLCIPPFAFFLRPLAAFLSRRDEYEADAFAAGRTGIPALQRALVRLHRDNASPLSADPWYVRFYYSHPPALMRIRRLQHTVLSTTE